MKHPALAKAFAVALAVMSLILLLGGIKGFETAKEENEERLRYENKFSERIANYVQLSEKLENSITYEEVWAELEELIEQHEHDASQHKTDLSLYTAEKGGNTMGADMIWEAKAQIKEAKAELEDGKAQLEQGEQQINMLLENEQLIRKAAALVAQGEAGRQQLIAELEAAIAALQNRPLPTPVPTPEATPENGSDESAQPEENTEGAENTTGTEDEPIAESPAPETEPVADDGETEPIVPALTTEEAPVQPEENPVVEENTGTNEEAPAPLRIRTMTRTSIKLASAELPTLPAVPDEYAYIWEKIKDCVPEINKIIGIIENLKNYPGLEGITVPQAMELIASITSDEEAILAANMLLDALHNMDGLFGYINETMNSMLEVLDDPDAAFAALEEGKVQLEAAAMMIEKMEHELQAQLENIWYNLGELEKDKLELAKEKLRLDDEASVLDKEIMEADALRELENDRVSAKLLLTSVKEVNDMYAESDDLVGSAEKYLQSYKAETESLRKGRIVSCVLAIIGGIAGIAALPAAYELIHKRFWLIWPVVISIICAAASEAVYYKSVHEMWYVGLFAAIIALLHLLIVAPKEKKPVIINET
ncbi:MAG: hypothetical protein IJE09_08390 [Oscillospiraceae bacterium]|nr:hypothetical protein [Oscillospiraceae bacterium]